MIGKSLAHYRIIRLLGEGGMDKYFRSNRSYLEISFAINSGNPDRALEKTREALATPEFNRLTPQLMRLDPLFDPLRDLEGFRDLLESKEPF